MALSRITRIKDPRKRAEAAADYLRKREGEAKDELSQIRQIRDDAARAMLDEAADGKWKYRPADVARALDMSRASVAERFPHAKQRAKQPT